MYVNNMTYIQKPKKKKKKRKKKKTKQNIKKKQRNKTKKYPLFERKISPKKKGVMNTQNYNHEAEFLHISHTQVVEKYSKECSKANMLSDIIINTNVKYRKQS